MYLLKRLVATVLGSPRPSATFAEFAGPASFEEQVYDAVVLEGDVCYDLGANFGEVALFLARRAGRGGMVVAFEPVMPVYCQLCAWVQLATDARAPLAVHGIVRTMAAAVRLWPVGRVVALGHLWVPLSLHVPGRLD